MPNNQRPAGPKGVSRTANRPRNQRVALNAAFRQYYQAQGIFAPEEEQLALDTLMNPLPVTFRINPTAVMAPVIRARLLREYEAHLADPQSGRVCPAVPVPWYPGGLAWVMPAGVDNRSAFGEFLKTEADGGSVTRQELVSMIPVALLDVEPHHRVLDMCAAPGSKTEQVLERMRTPDASGILIASDLVRSRCFTLAHQVGRALSPVVIVTSRDALKFPDLYVRYRPDPADPDRIVKKVLYFDRIICDVPCTGDGTMRKAVDLRQRWSPSMALHLHETQLDILHSAYRRLVPGGQLSFSTCSLNPLENEAVLAAFLDAHPDASVLDVRTRLPDLVCTPALVDWKVPGSDGVLYDSYEAAMSQMASGDAHRRMMTKTMFPSSSPETREQLQRSLRISPHHQNTGGFFIAIITKGGEMPDNALGRDLPPPEQLVACDHTAWQTKANDTMRAIDSATVNAELDSQFGVSDAGALSCLYTRSDANKRINLVSPTVNAVLTCTERRVLPVIYSGILVVERVTKGLVLDPIGARFMAPLMTRNVFHLEGVDALADLVTKAHVPDKIVAEIDASSPQIVIFVVRLGVRNFFQHEAIFDHLADSVFVPGLFRDGQFQLKFNKERRKALLPWLEMLVRERGRFGC